MDETLKAQRLPQTRAVDRWGLLSYISRRFLISYLCSLHTESLAQFGVVSYQDTYLDVSCVYPDVSQIYLKCSAIFPCMFCSIGSASSQRAEAAQVEVQWVVEYSARGRALEACHRRAKCDSAEVATLCAAAELQLDVVQLILDLLGARASSSARPCCAT